MNDYSPVLKSDKHRVEAVEGALLGSTIHAVVYRQLVGDQPVEPPHGKCHEVDLELLLVLNSGVIGIMPVQAGRTWGMAVRLLTVLDVSDDEGAVAVDGLPEWEPVVGKKISSVRLGWHRSMQGAPESLMSITLAFGNGLDVIAAMGSLDQEGLPQYDPDALLVVFEAGDRVPTAADATLPVDLAAREA
ncbi:hypothetical protein ABT297_37905 [Dactylosporangium sp. NPDC000555]|uniref:hypothetical protein n=1 Tax=Dactylosporangium sp. NPDC000555 TaxID=3154260 RepID=UPI0033229EA8